MIKKKRTVQDVHDDEQEEKKKETQHNKMREIRKLS